MSDPSSALIPTGDVSHLVELGKKLQEHASERNIHNVFDDGGFKELFMLTLFGMKKLGREGDDAIDEHGRQYEMKTVARVSSKGERKSSLQVTTEHTLTLANIERYRNVHLWIVAVFDQSEPEAIYEITPAALEPYFKTWESKLRDQARVRSDGSAPDHLNNPKIPLNFIAKHGIKVWPADPGAGVQLPLRVESSLDEAQHIDDAGSD